MSLTGTCLILPQGSRGGRQMKRYGILLALLMALIFGIYSDERVQHPEEGDERRK